MPEVSDESVVALFFFFAVWIVAIAIYGFTKLFALLLTLAAKWLDSYDDDSSYSDEINTANKK